MGSKESSLKNNKNNENERKEIEEREREERERRDPILEIEERRLITIQRPIENNININQSISSSDLLMIQTINENHPSASPPSSSYTSTTINNPHNNSNLNNNQNNNPNPNENSNNNNKENIFQSLLLTPRREDSLYSKISYTPVGEQLQIYKYYCPLCMSFFQDILKSSCCKNYICSECIVDFLIKRNYSVSFCLFCFILF